MYSAVDCRREESQGLVGRARAAATPVRWALIIKRGLDVLGSAAALMLGAPLLLASAVLIYLEDRGPVLFWQERVGRGGRSFRVCKFRSMRVNDTPVEEMGQVREDHPMVTRAGRILRRLKIDELPQLFNVLRGDMSLVGPRPTIREQVERYDAYERRRLLMAPGVTGWAQVNGNTRLEWSERILLDVWYVAHWSLRLDLKVLMRTVEVIVRGERPNEPALREAIRYADSTRRSG